MARHGTYARKRPAGTQIARWYCRESHTTFSLLPGCLAARLPGTLTELEEVVAEAEQSRSLMAVADQVRSDAVELPGAMRWVRRVLLVQHVLRLVIGLLPQQLSGCRAEVTACRQRLGSDAVSPGSAPGVRAAVGAGRFRACTSAAGLGGMPCAFSSLVTTW